jgi:hypothetical protein
MPTSLPVRVGRHPQLPIEGHAIREIGGEHFIRLRFDDHAQSALEISSEWRLVEAGGATRVLEPAGADARRALEMLIAVRIVAAGSDRLGRLVIGFEQGNAIEIPHGSFESWSYTASDGTCVIGGVGQVTVFGGSLRRE